MRVRAALVASGALVALLVGGPAASASGSDGVAAEPGLSARAEELARLEAPIAPGGGATPRLVFAGDSVAETLAAAFGAEARSRGATVSVSTRPGCGLLRGLPTTLDGYQPPWTTACDRESATWRRQIAAMQADVVVVLSTWDGSPRELDGTFVDPGTGTGRATAVELYRELVDDVAPPGSGRSVVLLAEAIPAPGASTGDATPTRIAEARQHRATLRDVARAMPDRVRVVDLGQWLCPTGPQCPPVLDDVAVRADDGGHFTADGAAWLAPRVLDALGV